MEAMLHVAGEVGFCDASVRRVLERSGCWRAQFYRHFSNTAACYEEAYAIEAERLCEELLGIGRVAPNWRSGLEAALERLAEFAIAQPMVARGVLIEVHVAGGPPLHKRQEVFERLSRAIDSARRETGSRHSSPPLTAMFIVHVIDAAMADALLRDSPERFSPGELTELAAIYYDLASRRTGASD